MRYEVCETCPESRRIGILFESFYNAADIYANNAIKRYLSIALGIELTDAERSAYYDSPNPKDYAEDIGRRAAELSVDLDFIMMEMNILPCDNQDKCAKFLFFLSKIPELKEILDN